MLRGKLVDFLPGFVIFSIETSYLLQREKVTPLSGGEISERFWHRVQMRQIRVIVNQ
jgi:hypothetical protein